MVEPVLDEHLPAIAAERTDHTLDQPRMDAVDQPIDIAGIPASVDEEGHVEDRGDGVEWLEREHVKAPVLGA